MLISSCRISVRAGGLCRAWFVEGFTPGSCHRWRSCSRAAAHLHPPRRHSARPREPWGRSCRELWDFGASPYNIGLFVFFFLFVFSIYQVCGLGHPGSGQAPGQLHSGPGPQNRVWKASLPWCSEGLGRVPGNLRTRPWPAGLSLDEFFCSFSGNYRV